jgi:antitoxin component YwqK of YwqJK toxin-antitoxin module
MRFLSLICLVFIISCDSGYNSRQTISEFQKPKPVYIEYSDSGLVTKYFDSEWNIIHDSTKATYYRTATYINGQPKEETTVKDYFISGKLQFEGFLSGENPDVPHGFTKWYNESGNLSSTRNYQKGKLHGYYRTYYESGNINVRISVIDDELEGEYIEYYDLENEPVKSKGIFKNGIPTGEFLEFYENGRIKKQKTYKKGELNGRKRTYHRNGKLEESIPYLDGQLSGNYYEYFSSGTPKTKGYYVDDSESGNWIYYDEDGDYKKFSYVTFRVGAICNDGTRSSATGRGACSWHGGVDHWLVRTEKRFIFGTGKFKNYKPSSYYSF